jgi:hypothetical protein
MLLQLFAGQYYCSYHHLSRQSLRLAVVWASMIRENSLDCTNASMRKPSVAWLVVLLVVSVHNLSAVRAPSMGSPVEAYLGVSDPNTQLWSECLGTNGSNFYDLSSLDIDMNPVNFSTYRGNVRRASLHLCVSVNLTDISSYCRSP